MALYATNQALLTAAYQQAALVDETLAPSATQLANGLTTMNGYLAMREVDGLYLGWYPQTSLTAAPPIRDEYAYGVMLLLCRQLAQAAGQPIEDPTLNMTIDNAEAILLKACRRTVLSDLSELPRPQGAPCGSVNWD